MATQNTGTTHCEKPNKHKKQKKRKQEKKKIDIKTFFLMSNIQQDPLIEQCMFQVFQAIPLMKQELSINYKLH